MRILVTGSREIKDTAKTRFLFIKTLIEHIKSGEDTITVVHGDCKTGADSIVSITVEKIADVSPRNWEEETYYADWDEYGRSAGPKRNQEMVDAGADVCLAFFQRGAGNKGTTNCANAALKAGIPVEEVWID